MQVLNGTGPGVKGSKSLLLDSGTCWKYSMETSQKLSNKVKATSNKVQFGNNVNSGSIE